MFLNIFSVTLSEYFIAYFLLHFTYPLRQVRRTKPCILACRIPRSFRDTKRISPLPFFSFRRPSKPKKRRKSRLLRAFTRTRKRQADVLPSCEPREKTAAQPRRILSVSIRNVITETVFQYRNPVRDSLPFRISVSIPDIRYTQPVLRTETAFQVRLYTQTILLY